MELGKTIKKLRRARDMTQEALAEALSISPQAVSRWECGDGMPDISLLPVLCHLFEVSADELLGIDVAKKEAEVKRISDEAMSYAQRGYTEKAETILRDGLRLYPGSEKLLHDLLSVTYWRADGDEKERYLDECVSIGERLLETGTRDPVRHSAIQLLCYIYSGRGQMDRARELAATMPFIYCSKESLTTHIERGDAQLRAMQQWNRTLYDELLIGLWWNVKLDDGTWAYTDDEQAILCEKALALIRLLFEDGNYGFSHCRIKELCLSQARYHAQKGDADKALAYLDEAADGALGFLAYARCEGHFTYTSLAFRGLEAGSFSTGLSDNDATEVLQYMGEAVFDLVRDTERFRAIADKLTPHAGKWEV